MENLTEQEKVFDKAFKIVALGSLSSKQLDTTNNSIDNESARIERCVEYHYKIDKEVKYDYPKFVKEFLVEHITELVDGDKFSGLYLDDLPDGTEKEYYLEDVLVME